MTSDNLLIVCRSCSRKILMHNMRPDGTGENMICVDCYKRNTPTKLMSISEAAQEQQPKPRKPVSNEKMIKYLCMGCKYKFSKKASQPVNKCPYCGKTDLAQDNSLGADKLLNDSMDKRFEKW